MPDSTAPLDANIKNLLAEVEADMAAPAEPVTPAFSDLVTKDEIQAQFNIGMEPDGVAQYEGKWEPKWKPIIPLQIAQNKSIEEELGFQKDDGQVRIFEVTQGKWEVQAAGVIFNFTLAELQQYPSPLACIKAKYQIALMEAGRPLVQVQYR